MWLVCVALVLAEPVCTCLGVEWKRAEKVEEKILRGWCEISLEIHKTGQGCKHLDLPVEVRSSFKTGCALSRGVGPEDFQRALPT